MNQLYSTGESTSGAMIPRVHGVVKDVPNSNRPIMSSTDKTKEMMIENRHLSLRNGKESEHVSLL